MQLDELGARLLQLDREGLRLLLGLGRTLTLAGLHHLGSRGAREVLLYVESDNTPARKVYERLGFTHAASDTHVQFTRP